jgi:hypothetical protein
VKKLGWIFVLALGVLLIACDRAVLPYVPAEEEPPPSSRPVRIPGLENPTPRGRRVAPAPAGSFIRGTVRLGPGIAAPGEGALFVIARSQGGGPPLAVKRLPLGPFPLSFEIGQQDVMMQDTALLGPVLLSAKIDRDGNPMTSSPADLTAQASQPVEPGGMGAELVLQHTGG